MEIKDFTLHHAETNEDFDVIAYGNSGRPVIVFPDVDASCTCWEENGMIDALSELIDYGSVRLFCVDSADQSSWYAKFAPEGYRLESVSAYFDFVEQELADLISRECGEAAGLPILAGAGTGALNATIEMMRRPKHYAGLLAMSGTYDARNYVGEGMSEEWLGFSPVDLAQELVRNGAAAHAFETHQLAFVCGQGNGEAGIETQRALDTAFAQAKIKATFEYWGYDVTYGWDWWKEEAKQLLPCLLSPSGLAERAMSGKLDAAKKAADQAEQDLADSNAELENARGALDEAIKQNDSMRERAEREQRVVADRSAVAERLANAAKQAWAERDKIAAQLADAEARAKSAQAEADGAESERSKAEWIAGEAIAARDAAAQKLDAAKTRLADAENLEKVRTDAAKAASEALDSVMGQVEELRKSAAEAAEAAAKAAAEKAAKAAKAAAARKPAAKKAATKKSTAKGAASKTAAAKKPAAKKPAAKKTAAKKTAAAPKATAEKKAAEDAPKAEASDAGSSAEATEASK